MKLKLIKIKNLDKYKNVSISSNPNVPKYEAEYQLDNNNYNVKRIRDLYDVSTKKAPILKMQSVGELKGNSIGYKNIEYIFSQNEDENIKFSNYVNFQPSKGE